MASALREIAGKLNVSASTVSRALSGKPGVSAALRRKIIRYAASRGIAPNMQAQALRSGRGHGLVLVARPRESHIGMVRNDLILSFARRVFPSVRLQYLNETESVNEAIARALAFYPAAIIMPGSAAAAIAPGVRQRVRRQQVALVGLDTRIPGFDAVLLDRVPGMYRAVKLLLDSGCRHNVFMTLDSLSNPDARLRAVIRAYREANLSINDIRLHVMPRDLPHGHAKGYRETMRLIEHQPVDGLFCFNDQLAVGALKALSESGSDVPANVKVIGFDNLPESAFARVPLTTVAWPVEKVAKVSVELCARRIENPEAKAVEKIIPTRLVVRNSAPAPNAEYAASVDSSTQRIHD